jgi:hypothetical protein
MPAAGLFSIREVQALLGARIAGGLVKSGLAVVVGYQVYELTRSPFALASLGLVQAIPSLGLAMYGGHLADRRDRRSISLWTTVVVLLSVLLLAAIAAVGGDLALGGRRTRSGRSRAGSRRGCLASFRASCWEGRSRCWWSPSSRSACPRCGVSTSTR